MPLKAGQTAPTIPQGAQLKDLIGQFQRIACIAGPEFQGQPIVGLFGDRRIMEVARHQLLDGIALRQRGQRQGAGGGLLVGHQRRVRGDKGYTAQIPGGCRNSAFRYAK